MKKLLFILFLLPLSLIAQEDKAALERDARKLVREGNELFNQLKFADAEVAYKKALEKNPSYEIANYNLGNAFSLQNRSKEAVTQYELVAKMTKDKFTRAEATHNTGNSHYQDKEYQKAVDSYKHSLRANPKDDETRYNLALAQKMLKDQQQNQDKNDENKDKDKDQENKDDKNKDKDEDKKEGDDKKDDEKKDGEDEKDKDNPEKDKEDKKQDQKPQPGKLSPQQMKQLLEAMNNEEKKTQEKMNAKKERGKKIKQEKDW
jgi:tetratricopeptide (TPR) repeat protein